MVKTGKYTLPAWICGGFFILLLLWLSGELLTAYREHRESSKHIESAVSQVVEQSAGTFSSMRKNERQKQALSSFHNKADDALSVLARKTYLVVDLFVLGSFLVFCFYLAWTYALRNRELSTRLESALSRKEEIDELGLAAAGLAHETKNPLGVIRGLAQNIANNTENSEETRQRAREIMEETDVTTARLGDFLSYARFRSPAPEEINSVKFLERLSSLISDDFMNAGVKLETEIDPLVLYADSDMLSQVLMNLLTNSLKFSEPGGKLILTCKRKRGNTAELKIIDTGRGIDPKLLPDVFKPYVTKGAGGFGVGLAIVKRIVDQAGWRISIKSKIDKGTTVVISGIATVSGGTVQ